jgi:hypothetical protein
MTMIIPDAPELVAMTFGTDDAVARVLTAMIDHENTDPGAVYYGETNWSDTVTADHALREAGHERIAWTVFSWSGAFFLNAEWSAALFESLTDYALSESVCDDDGDGHRGYAGDACDCERRDRAWSWASSIAETTAGIELI